MRTLETNERPIVAKRRSLVHQLLPRTLAGLAVWILLFSAGVAGSGVVLYAHYQFKLASIQNEMEGFSERSEKDFKDRSKDFTALVKDSKAEIEKATRGAGAQTNEVSELLERVGPSIAYVQGTDAAGAPAVASGFVVTSNANESWIVTNFRVVAGGAASKGNVRVRIGEANREGTIWTWDDRRDLALVIVRGAGNLKALEWAKSDAAIGSLVWAVGTGAGKFHAAASKGHVTDAAGDGILSDAGVPVSSSGGPLLTNDGRVLGVLTLNYAPDGFPPSSGWAVPIRLTCQKVLKCPG